MYVTQICLGCCVSMDALLRSKH